jgi:hypothetical protein
MSTGDERPEGVQRSDRARAQKPRSPVIPAMAEDLRPVSKSEQTYGQHTLMVDVILWGELYAERWKRFKEMSY